MSARPMTSDQQATQEPSMEEILASIRRIISEDGKDKPEAAAEPAPLAVAEPEPASPSVQAPVVEEPVHLVMDDVAEPAVLELTDMVAEDGSIVDLTAPVPAAVSEPESAPVVEHAPEPKIEQPKPQPRMVDDMEALISRPAISAATSALASLADTLQTERQISSQATIGDGSKTLESLVVEMMKPMLREWLDQNLPQTVERLVQKEIRRITSNLQD